MAYPDLSDIRQRLRDILSESGVSFYTNAMLNRWINDGQWDVADKSLCYEREHSLVTVVNTRSVVISATKLLSLEYLPTSGSRMGLGRILPQMVGHINLTGVTPQYWFMWGNRVCIEPIPTAVYNLVGYIASHPLQILTSDTDEPEIPVAFIPWVIEYAHIRALMRDKQWGKAAYRYSQYITDMAMARSNVLRKHANSRSDFDIPNVVEAIKVG